MVEVTARHSGCQQHLMQRWNWVFPVFQWTEPAHGAVLKKPFNLQSLGRVSKSPQLGARVLVQKCIASLWFHKNGCHSGASLGIRDFKSWVSHFHFLSADSCSSKGLTSLSGVLTLSVLTMQVGRWRFSITISCCLSTRSSSIWAFSSEFTISKRSDSWTKILKFCVLIKSYTQDVTYEN